MVTLKNPGALSFDAFIERAEIRGSSAFVPISLDVDELFGSRGQIPVNATFDGQPYRGSIMSRSGTGRRLLIPLDLQDHINKHAGDTVSVTLELDTAERAVELDADVEKFFENAGVLDAFRVLSYSHQKEFANWIADAKRTETRERRVAKAVMMIASGERLT
jgi:hypothetical protein